MSIYILTLAETYKPNTIVHIGYNITSSSFNSNTKGIILGSGIILKHNIVVGMDISIQSNYESVYTYEKNNKSDYIRVTTPSFNIGFKYVRFSVGTIIHNQHTEYNNREKYIRYTKNTILIGTNIGIQSSIPLISKKITFLLSPSFVHFKDKRNSFSFSMGIELHIINKKLRIFS